MPPWLVDLLGRLNMTQVLMAAFTGVVSIGGAWATVRIARIKGKPEIQAVVNDGYSRLVNAFQEERATLVSRIDEQDDRIAELQRKVTAQTLRIFQLEGALKSAGMALPPEVAG